MNHKTTITKLYTFNDVHAYIEYPETGTETLRPVGYLLRRDPGDWQDPVHNFAYSLGDTWGRTKKGTSVTSILLTDVTGIMVPCAERHFKCV